MSERNLVKVRRIGALSPIPGADAIEVARVDDWEVVVKRGDFSVGDSCVYMEIDSFLPEGNSAWQFLVDKQPKMFNGVKGHKLRTIKLRGQISQGLVMPLHAFPIIQLAIKPELEEGVLADIAELGEEILAVFKNLRYGIHEHPALSIEDMDFASLLGVVKYEPPLPAELAGIAAGLYPSFIKKTDQERCQNIGKHIFGYESERRFCSDWLDPTVSPPSVGVCALVQLHDGSEEEVTWCEADLVSAVSHWRPVVYEGARANRDDEYEVTMKLDGSSMTAFMKRDYRDEELFFGVCSRNLELKVTDDSTNTFVRVFIDSGLRDAMKAMHDQYGIEIAVQGELMGPGIQGNREGLAKHEFFVFDIWDIKTSSYMAPMARAYKFDQLLDHGAKINHVPMVCIDTLDGMGITDVPSLLKYAEGPSMKHPVREGLVFKRMDGEFSFKAISNAFLAKEKD
jgi:hypothetical protein